MVVNPFRPWSGSPQAVAEQVRAIEASSQLRVSGLVANPHLGPWTEQAHLQAGLQKVREAAVLIGGTGSQPVRSELPLVCLAVERSLASAAAALGAPVLPLELHLRPPWQGW